MSELWTDRQSEAINTRGRNILVSAAAGSGKTAVLVERIKKLIIDERISIDEILVATFTNAAAGDMKEKIVRALQKAIAENQGDRRFLKDQLNGVYKANISTFHSFALEVIRRYFYVIDADPDFKICDDGEKAILQSEAIDALFEDKFNGGESGFVGFLKAYCGAKSEKKAKDMVLYLHECIQALPEPWEWLSEKTALLAGSDGELHDYLIKFMMDDAVENLGFTLSSFRDVKGILDGNGIPGLSEKCSRDIGLVENILGLIKAGDYGEAASAIRSAGFERFVSAAGEKAAYESVKDQIGRIRDKAKACVKEVRDNYFNADFEEEAGAIRATHEYVKTLAGLTIDFDVLFKEKKKEKNLLDFNDIEHMALQILKNSGAGGEYRKKFKYIFVDEYQDSNLLQEAMVNLIKREDNVFMVGDVKQSIYKFRLAEPEIFIRKYEAYKSAPGGSDMKIDLNTNFRSKSGVIKAVNDICGKIMPYGEDSALKKGIAYSGPMEYAAQLHIVETKEIEGDEIDNEINEMKGVELEAAVVAGLIKGALGEAICADVKDGKESIRGIELKDIVILMRSVKSHGEKYYQILTENGIPVYIDDSGGYFDTVEIEIFMNLLRIIDNRRRDIPLISALHSRMMDFSASELAMIRTEGDKKSYYDAFERYGLSGDDKELRAKCKNACEKIEEWRGLALTLPLEEFIWKLLWDTGYYIYAGALPGGAQRQANLRALVDKSLKYANINNDGLYGFLRFAARRGVKAVKPGRPALAGETGTS